MTPTLRLSAEFGAGPLWVVSDDPTVEVNPDPREVLPPTLAAQVWSWDARYQAVFDAGYPPDSRWPEVEDEVAWSADGRALAREIAAAVGAGYDVVHRDVHAAATIAISGPDVPPAPEWQYYLLAPDADTALIEADAGHGRLLRAVPGREYSYEQVLRVSGEWAGCDLFYEEHFRGTVYEHFVPIERERAERIVTRWVELGRQPYLPPVERRIPAEWAARILLTEEREAVQDRVRRDALDPTDVERVRRTVLHGPMALDERWSTDGAKVVAPFDPALFLTDLTDCARIADAFRTAGAAACWALFCAPHPDPPRRPIGTPEGVRLALAATSLRGFHDLGLYGHEVVLTTPELDCALLRTIDYGLACGSVAFVEAALGAPVTAARAAFADYARDLRDPFDEQALRGVVQRFT